MTKDTAYEVYSAAGKLRFSSPNEDWLRVFPDAASIHKFRDDIKHLSFPENYGASIFDDALSIASTLRRTPYTDAHIKELAKEMKNEGHARNFTIPKLRIAAAYGIPIPFDIGIQSSDPTRCHVSVLSDDIAKRHSFTVAAESEADLVKQLADNFHLYPCPKKPGLFRTLTECDRIRKTLTATA